MSYLRHPPVLPTRSQDRPLALFSINDPISMVGYLFAPGERGANLPNGPAVRRPEPGRWLRSVRADACTSRSNIRGPTFAVGHSQLAAGPTPTTVE